MCEQCAQRQRENVKNVRKTWGALHLCKQCGGPPRDAEGRLLPENIRAAIGPNIGMCHFETDADVPDAMRAAFGAEVDGYIEKRGEKYHLDLKQINAMVLRRCGVTHIEISEDCTVCSCDRFWSHRATRGERGSQGAVIVCGGGL